MIFSYIALVTGAILTSIMLLFHLFFGKLFRWKEDFQSVSVTNKKIIITIHVALILFFLFVVLATFMNLKELMLCSGIGLSFLIMISVFWFWRAVWQILFFKSDLKKSKTGFAVHIILILLFLMLSILYVIPVIIAGI